MQTSDSDAGFRFDIRFFTQRFRECKLAERQIQDLVALVFRQGSLVARH